MRGAALKVRAALALALVVGAVAAGVTAAARTDDLRVVPARTAAPADLHHWQPVRGRAPQCIAAGGIGAAIYVDRQHVDLIDAGQRRFRLTLAQPCGELSYYHSFYYRVGKDGAFCAGRDHLVSRAGRICDVRGIERLQPPAPRRRSQR